MADTTLHSTQISIPLGIVIGLFASFVQSLGLTIQRKSHVLNQLLPEHQQRVEHRRPLWLLGFVVFISSNVIGSLVQIASLPVVILAPLGAVSLLWNALFARFILGDVFSPWMILGTILIAGGAVLIAFFGIVPEPTRSLEDLVVLFSRPAFVIYFSILGSAVLTHIADFALSRKLSRSNVPLSSSCSDTHSTHALASSQGAAALTTGLPTSVADAGISTERTPLLKPSIVSPASSLYGKRNDPDMRAINRTRLLLAISYSSFSGIISGMCLLFAKSGVELLLLTLRGQNQFWRWQAWVLVLGLVVFALLQLWYLHKALILADPTLVCPSAFCFYNVSSITNGLVYFNQFSLIPPLHLGLVAFGMTVLLGGVWIVSVQSGVKERDIETWSESGDSDIDETSVDVEEACNTPPRFSVEFHPVPMERGTRSESDIPNLTRLNYSAHELDTSAPLRPSSRHHLSREGEPSMHSSTVRSRVNRRRRTTFDDGGTSHRRPPLLPINTLGTGFQIGLSPVSPGFALQPRERGRRLSARGIADVTVNATLDEERQRRRTVSEGDVRKGVLETNRPVDRESEDDDQEREDPDRIAGRHAEQRRDVFAGNGESKGAREKDDHRRPWLVRRPSRSLPSMPAARWSPAVPPVASPVVPDRLLKSRPSNQFMTDGSFSRSTITLSNSSGRVATSGTPVINISVQNNNIPSSSINATASDEALADELDYITVTAPNNSSPINSLSVRPDKASRILGIKHRRSMEPIPASTRNSIVSTRSMRDPDPVASFVPTLPLTSLYVVSGLPKSPHTWTLADPDAVLGLHHSEGAVSRWWRPEVLGSTVSPGAGGGKKKKRGKGEEVMKGAGALSKQEVGKMLSKALKLSFTREVEVIASTLQPASTIHTFTFTLPAPSTPLAPTPSGDLLRASVLSSTDNRSSAATFAYPYTDDPFVRPSSAYLGPPSFLSHGSNSNAAAMAKNDINPSGSSTITYHGVCLTVWSHADAERSAAIRRTLEAGRSRKESAQSIVASRLKNLRAEVSGSTSDILDPTTQAKRTTKKNARGPWADAETDGADTEADGAMSESDLEVASTVGHGPGETLVSRHPVYDLMRDYLTLSWARFSKDVQSHTLQISKILAHPAPRAGDLIKLDASPKSDGVDSNLEVIARFPGGLDFGRGLVDINFTMWPLFKCLNIDNILTICEIALAPTGRILFFSRHPAMLGIAVFTIKYLVELRGWNGISLPAVHSRDAKIYIDDPGPWIMGLSTEARYSIRPAPEVCVCDLDINYLSCPSPPPGVVSVKHQRDRYRQRLLGAFDSHYHPDHSVPSEFKEAFPAGRFRPVCKIQTKRGASSTAVAEQIKPPEWWHSTRIIQAFDAVLQDRYKKPSLLKRISMFGAVKRPPQLTAAEQLIQHSIRKRATAFVDARDDLETKIGRLSRRLNFLMTESDLWRDKFVTFEQYAEKLSAEANQLRNKINKEQRETKRLSGLVTLTAAEKSKLQNQLKETELAHKEAILELERMRETMEKMERERAEMVAEVEAQIERALASMAVDLDESDYANSRPNSRPSSRLSSTSRPSRSRQPSDAATKARLLRLFGTEETLAETYGEIEDEELPTKNMTKTKETIPEADGSMTPNKRRFSASELNMPQDGMSAVDEGISVKSDKIAQKVLEIEQKLENALAAERRSNKQNLLHGSGDESSDVPSIHRRAPKSSRSKPMSKSRTRSGTASSTQTGTSTHTDETIVYSRSHLVARTEQDTSTRHTISDRDNQSTPEPPNGIQTHPSPSSVQSPPVSLSTSSLTPATSTTGTDDSDTDFQSAYSTSPRGSYGNLENDQDENESSDKITLKDSPTGEQWGARS
ncbi:hypothetical protein C0995_008759 [Termitomyces sp. Mi166|nr:hypothetical protein C0995_008759 [Termitomyces sp. Mi166\